MPRLAFPVLLAYGRAIVLAALSIGRAERDAPHCWRGRRTRLSATGEGPLPVRTEPILPPAKFGLSYARRVARVRSWTPMSRLPRALAIQQQWRSAIIRCCAMWRMRSAVVGFRHAETILDAARRKTGRHPMLRKSRTRTGLLICRGGRPGMSPIVARALESGPGGGAKPSDQGRARYDRLALRRSLPGEYLDRFRRPLRAARHRHRGVAAGRTRPSLRPWYAARIRRHPGNDRPARIVGVVRIHAGDRRRGRDLPREMPR